MPNLKLKRTPKPASAEPNVDRMDALLDQVMKDHPDWDANQVGEEAFRRFEAEQPVAKPKGRWAWLPALGVVALLLIVGLLAFLIFRELRPDPDPQATATTAATAAPLTSIAFSPTAPNSVAAGQSVRLPLTTSSGGTPLAPAALEVVVNPPEAGQARVLNESGAIVVEFTAGQTPGPAELIVRGRDNPEVATQPFGLTIAGAPTLTVAPAPSNPKTARPGEPFEVKFIITNAGSTAAQDVWLEVDTPAGLTISRDGSFASQQCSGAGQTARCPLGSVPGGNDAAQIILNYSAAAPGAVTFAAGQVRLTYAGGGPITASGDHTVSIESPTATSVTLTPARVELAADGVMTTTIAVAVVDQDGQPFTGLASISLSLARDGETAPPATNTPSPTYRCRIASNAIIREGVPTDSAELEGGPLQTGTEVEALAYVPDGQRLFVVVPDGSNRQGWVSVTVNGGNMVDCGAADLGTLPLEPPVVSPPANGQILEPTPLSITGGAGAVTYQAGSTAGLVTLSAQLLGADGAPLGAPAQTAIQLLEAGRLNAPSHLYADANNAAGDTGQEMVLFRMPAGTALELYPPDAALPGARQAGVRLWLPAAGVAGPEATALLSPLPAGARAFAGAGPDDALNSPAATDQVFGLAAAGYAVELLGPAVNDYYPARLIVWVAAGAVETGRPAE